MDTALSQYRQKVQALEKAMLEYPQIEMQVDHYFAHGTYTRVLHIPKGACVTGKIHRHSCINIMPKGKMRVVTDEGENDIEAPFIGVSGAGVKKAVYALEDTIWVNVHPWDGEADLEQIEAEVIVPSFEMLDSEVRECLGRT